MHTENNGNTLHELDEQYFFGARATYKFNSYGCSIFLQMFKSLVSPLFSLS